MSEINKQISDASGCESITTFAGGVDIEGQERGVIGGTIMVLKLLTIELKPMVLYRLWKLITD